MPLGPNRFSKTIKGAIPPNVLTAANTRSNDPYLQYCKANDISLHPARMPDAVAKFFVNFLTDPGDLILDPFAGSNVTGAVAELLGRRWIGIEVNPEYAQASKSRFSQTSIKYL